MKFSKILFYITIVAIIVSTFLVYNYSPSILKSIETGDYTSECINEKENYGFKKIYFDNKGNEFDEIVEFTDVVTGGGRGDPPSFKVVNKIPYTLNIIINYNMNRPYGDRIIPREKELTIKPLEKIRIEDTSEHPPGFHSDFSFTLLEGNIIEEKIIEFVSGKECLEYAKGYKSENITYFDKNKLYLGSFLLSLVILLLSNFPYVNNYVNRNRNKKELLAWIIVPIIILFGLVVYISVNPSYSV